MRARVAKWGNSLAIRLPKAAVEKFRLHAGARVEVSIESDRTEIRAPHPHYSLDALLAQITPGAEPEVVDFAPAGEEAL
ncbi:MAG: AbrB/MazE/SpoVT family DNA-binding domain-containing protein [Rhodospirillales bacterium]